MARSHARFELALFSSDRDADLATLSKDAKLLYVVIVTDPALNFAGVVLLRPGVWQEEASLDDDEFDLAFDELEKCQFTVVDRRTCELLIRSFIRNDGVADQPNVLKGALSQAQQTRSRVIRRALAVELRRLPPKPPDKIGKNNKPISYPDPHACAALLDPDGPAPDGSKPSPNSSRNPTSNPSGNPSPNPSAGTLPGRDTGTPGGRGRGRGEGSCSVGTPVLPGATAPRGPATSTEPDGFAEWYAAYPRHEARAKAVTAYRSALRKRGVTAEVLLAGAQRYAALVRAEGRDRSKIAHPATWLNGERWADEIPTGAPIGLSDIWTIPDDQLTDDDVDELLGPGRPPEPPDEFDLWDRDRRHAWNRENYRQWKSARREQAIRSRAERLARVTRLDDHRRDIG